MATKPTPTKNKAAAAAAHQNRAPARAQAAPQRAQAPARAAPAPARASVPAQVRQQAPANIDENLPAFMQNDAEMGKENIGREDIETPRLKLMQGLSPELQMYDGLRPGFFFHTAAEHIFDGPFRAVPIFMDKRYILWRPRDQGGGILARADDGVHWSPANATFDVQLDKKDGGHKVTWKTAETVAESGLNLWGTMNPNDPDSPPAATQMYNFVLAFPDFPDLMPAVFSFQRSSIKTVRRFITKIKTTRGPLFSRIYTFAPFVDHNKAGQEFQNVNMSGAGIVEDEDQYNAYKDMHAMFSSAGLTVKDLETAQDDLAGDEVIDEPAGQQQGGRRY